MPIRVRPGVKWAPFAKKTSSPYRGDGPPKALLHATITPSTTLPGYKNQSTAPHETLLWNPTRKALTVVTHLYFDQHAKALENDAGGVETNHDEVLQWELAGYLGSSTPKGQFDILTAPNVYWEAVADAIGDIVISWRVANKFSRSFDAGISEKNKARRMSFAEWDGFSGFCTHADTPENMHWDSPLGARVRLILQDKIWPKPIVIPVIKEIDVPRIIQVTGKPAQYLTTGSHLYWIRDQKALANVRKTWGASLNATPVQVPNLDGMGVPVGDIPPA